MIDQVLIAGSAAASLAAAVPCIRGILAGAYRPVPVTWAIWAALAAIAGFSALGGGQMPAAVLALASAAECAVVAVLAARVPARLREPPVRCGPVRLDWICGAGAVAGLVMLTVVRAPAAAIAVALGADFLAYVPTLVNFWRVPDDESPLTYVLYAASGGLALAAADRHLFTAVAYPLYLLAADSAGVAVMLSRRAGENRARRSWVPPADPRRWRENSLQGLSR